MCAAGLITQGRTPFDRQATVRMDGDVVAELEALLEALGLSDDRGASATAEPSPLAP